MAKFISRYPSLGFYVNGELNRFSNGQYVTEDKDTIVVLSGINDVEIVVEPQASEPKTEAKPTTKPSTRKASAK